MSTTVVLSLGAGVQSTTLLLMACKGELPKPDMAIFADTGWEPRVVYNHLEWLKGEASANGIPVHIVSDGNIKADALRSQVRRYNKVAGERWASLPYFTLSPTGGLGQVRRQCTAEYKINPIHKYLRREVLGLRHGQRAPREPVIEQWRGISLDETRRAAISRERWVDVRYPLITDIPLRREECVLWLHRNYPERQVPRSACLGCPYHSDAEWRNIKKTSPDEWADVVSFDYAIRHSGGMRGDVYLHASRRPLDEVDFDNAEDRGQLNFLAECEGMCGL